MTARQRDDQRQTQHELTDAPVLSYHGCAGASDEERRQDRRGREAYQSCPWTERRRAEASNGASVVKVDGERIPEAVGLDVTHDDIGVCDQELAAIT
jgi:hypothetical protein